MGRKSRKKEAITEERCVFIRPTGAVCNAIVVATVSRAVNPLSVADAPKAKAKTDVGDDDAVVTVARESREVCTEHRRVLYADGYTE